MNDKERIFVEAYFASGCNQTAGYLASHPGIKYASRTNSSKYFHSKKVQEALAEWREEQKQRETDAYDALNQQLLDRIFADFTDFADVVAGIEGDYVQIKNLNKLTPRQKQLIRSIKPTRDGIELQLESRDKAIEIFCKLHGYMKDSVNLSVDTSPKLADAISQLGASVFDEEENGDENGEET